jgi:hypothetical protein
MRPADVDEHVAWRLAGRGDPHGRTKCFVPGPRPTNREERKRLIQEVRERERPMTTSGIHGLTSKLTNAIWKRCEFAIQNSETILQEATSPP